MNAQQLLTLQSVGLTLKEARAYVALLELGRGSAAAVAKKADLKTPTAYVVLKDLINKGFVQRVPRAKKQLFMAESPAAALAAVENRAAEFRTLVPVLAALARSGGGDKAKILFFEGVAGVRKAYHYRIEELRDAEFVAFYASAEDVSSPLHEVLVDWSARMARANMTARAVAPEHPSLEFWRGKDTEFKRSVKIVSRSKYSARNSIEIFGQFVRIAMYGNEQAIIIDDANIAESLRQIFEMVWQGLPSRD